MKGIGTGNPKPMVALSGEITNATSEHARLTLHTAYSGAMSPRWHFARGLSSEGVADGDRGPGSINVNSYFVGGTKVFYNDGATDGRVKLRIGNPKPAEISGGAIDFISTNMIVDKAAAPRELATINGGTVGDTLIIRSANDSRPVTVKDGTGNIRCGADKVLTSKYSTLSFLFTANDGWVCTGGSDNS